MASLQKDAYKTLPYFHEQFNSTEEVATYIKKKGKGKHGHFLLRPSTRNTNVLTASILVQDKSVRHTHIQIEGDGTGYKYFLVVEKKFRSVQDLINFYKLNPIKNLENVNNVNFLYPLVRPGYANGSAGSRLGFSRNGSVISSGSSSSLNQSQGPPPLPNRPRAVSESTDASGNSNSSASLQKFDHISHRPPAPLPPSANQSNGDDTYCYSRARDVEEDVSEKLKDALKSSEKCECGIPRNLAELPLGWTVHLSKDENTFGRLFYQSDDGVTSWNLPQNVRMQLTKKHHDNLKVIDKTWTLTPRKPSSQRL